jgi:hypothetical protein
VAALVTVLGVTSGFEHALTSKLARVNGHVLLSEYGQDFDEYPAVIERWRADPRVAAASPFAYAMAAVVPAAARGRGCPGGQAVAAPAIALVKGSSRRWRRDAGGAEMLRAATCRRCARAAGTRRRGWRSGIGWRAARGGGRRLRVNLVIPAELDGTAASLQRPPRHATFEVLDLLDTGVTRVRHAAGAVHLSRRAGAVLRRGAGHRGGVLAARGGRRGRGRRGDDDGGSGATSGRRRGASRARGRSRGCGRSAGRCRWCWGCSRWSRRRR